MRNNIEIKKWAPVLIPTLCRYEHFKRCIESLSACIGAEYTEVYIGLDFPSKESQWDGYNKIKKYLSVCGYLNFKEIHIVARNRNYGFGRKGNLMYLIKDVIQCHDRYIVSEDDNIFSPNFLIYINKGLVISERDSQVFSVCGYSYPFPYKFCDNNYYSTNSDFCAWGYGILVKNSISFHEDMDRGYIGNTFSLRNYLKIRKKGWYLLHRYINCVLHDKVGDFNYSRTDMVLCIYMVLKGMNVIKPSLSKVQNIGWDETGQSFVKGVPEKLKEIANRHLNESIDTNTTFNFIGDPMSYYEYNNHVTSNSGEWPMTYIEYLSSVFNLFISGLKKLFKKMVSLNDK